MSNEKATIEGNAAVTVAAGETSAGTLPVAQAPTQLIDVVTRAASDPNVDVAKMDKILAMMERLEDKNAERQFNVAMHEAQGEMRQIGTDLTNPQTRSKYASYGKLDRILRPIYTKHGFSVSFDTGDSDPGFLTVLAYVAHESGHTRTYRAPMPADGKGAKGGDVMTKTHAAGSAMSYGMRYLLKMIFNVAVGEDDDDGNAAGLETITEKQAADILAMMDEYGTDRALFLKYFSIDEVAHLPAKHFETAVQALRTTPQRKAK